MTHPSIQRPALHRPQMGWLRLSCTLLLMGGALSACASKLEVRGNEPDPQAVAQIQPGKSTKAQVTQLLGSPTNVSTFNPDIWYYISSRDKRVSFLDPTLLDQKIYVVEFDDRGLVKDVQQDMNTNQQVAMNPRTTPAPGKELTIWEQLIGNFGRFSNSSTPAGAGNAGTISGPGGL
ncbi:MAG TPA: outer membrane protein assembly factor BamE [Stellaceae bacterium]|nr:outer membrane protein assembly factor BamE [Stellaceae bacterium]